MPSLSQTISILLPLLAGYLRAKEKGVTETPDRPVDVNCACHCDVEVAENSWIGFLVGLLIGILIGSGACKEVSVRFRANEQPSVAAEPVHSLAVATPSSRYGRKDA